MIGILNLPLDKSAMIRFEQNVYDNEDVIQYYFNESTFNEFYESDLWKKLKSDFNIVLLYGKNKRILDKNILESIYQMIQEDYYGIHDPIFYTLETFISVAIRFDTALYFFYENEE